MKEIKWVKFILLLRKKHFRWLLSETLIYALEHYATNRGSGASDVLIFDKYYSNIIFKSNKE